MNRIYHRFGSIYGWMRLKTIWRLCDHKDADTFSFFYFKRSRHKLRKFTLHKHQLQQLEYMAVPLHAHSARYYTTLCLKASCDTNVVLCSAGPYGAEVVWCADHIVMEISNLLVRLVVIDGRMKDQQTNRNALPRKILCFGQLIQRKR